MVTESFCELCLGCLKGFFSGVNLSGYVLNGLAFREH